MKQKKLPKKSKNIGKFPLCSTVICKMNCKDDTIMFIDVCLNSSKVLFVDTKGNKDVYSYNSFFVRACFNHIVVAPMENEFRCPDSSIVPMKELFWVCKQYFRFPQKYRNQNNKTEIINE